MASIEKKSSYEHFPPPQEIYDPQRYYVKREYTKDLEAGGYSPPHSPRPSSDIVDRDDKGNGWDSRMETDGTLPDGNSAIVLLDPEKKSGAMTTKWQPPKDPNIVWTRHAYYVLTDKV